MVWKCGTRPSSEVKCRCRDLLQRLWPYEVFKVRSANKIPLLCLKSRTFILKLVFFWVHTCVRIVEKLKVERSTLLNPDFVYGTEQEGPLGKWRKEAAGWIFVFIFWQLNVGPNALHGCNSVKKKKRQNAVLEHSAHSVHSLIHTSVLKATFHWFDFVIFKSSLVIISCFFSSHPNRPTWCKML